MVELQSLITSKISFLRNDSHYFVSLNSTLEKANTILYLMYNVYIYINIMQLIKKGFTCPALFTGLLFTFVHSHVNYEVT